MPVDPSRSRRHALGVDFGTSNTVAVARHPDGRVRPLLVDGSPLLPSAVFAEADGTLLVGRDAVHSARLDPARFEPNPKRRVDDGLVLLGDREYPVEELIAAVLGRVLEEWRRATGEHLPDVTLTCPATWGSTRRELLAAAAAAAGLPDARLVAEPVAAATYFAEVLGRDVPVGSVLVVHDFGAGTFDASVVARNAGGFEVMAVDGRDDVGGLDVDAAVVEHLWTDDDDPAWRRLREPGTVEERRAQRQLWDDVRIAKERLSRAQTADLVVPLLEREAHLTRDELEQLARPVLDQTVQVTRSLLRWADLPEGRLAGVFLVGGATRIPLVATLLHRALAEAPVAIEQPELVVAEGSVLADAALLASGPAAPGPTGELRLVSARRSAADTHVVQAVPRQPADLTALRIPVADPAPTALRVTDAAPATEVRPPAGPDPADLDAPVDDTGDHPPAVDPWPDATKQWARDPNATATHDGLWPQARIPAARRPVSPAAVHVSGAAPVSGASGAAPSSGAFGAAASSGASGAAPVSGGAGAPVPGGVVTGRASARSGAVAARPRRPSRAGSTAAWPVAPAPRRAGGLLRAVQLLISAVVLLAVPAAALVVGYGWGNGEPLSQDAVRLVEDIARLLGVHLG